MLLLVMKKRIKYINEASNFVILPMCKDFLKKIPKLQKINYKTDKFYYIKIKDFYLIKGDIGKFSRRMTFRIKYFQYLKLTSD